MSASLWPQDRPLWLSALLFVAPALARGTPALGRMAGTPGPRIPGPGAGVAPVCPTGLTPSMAAGVTSSRSPWSGYQHPWPHLPRDPGPACRAERKEQVCHSASMTAAHGVPSSQAWAGGWGGTLRSWRSGDRLGGHPGTSHEVSTLYCEVLTFNGE